MKKITSSEVIGWAEKFLSKAESELRKDELKEQKKYASLIQNPNSKALLSKLLDESSQIRNQRILAKRVRVLIKQYGVPDFFTPFEQFQLRLFAWIGYLFYPIAIPLFKRKLRLETAKIIIPEERPALTHHLSSRSKEAIGQNINILGDVVLGDREANNRYYQYLNALKSPDISYISIKLSGIYAQIRPLNYDYAKKDLLVLVSSIFRQAMKHSYIDEKGEELYKFVNLDMEEFKDVELTLDVFIEVLGADEFKGLTAGLVIQAYLPSALTMYRKVAEFAKERYAKGGAPLKIRLVKGANQQMESIIASQKGWESPILSSKVEVDSNFLKILDEALVPENAKALHVGVASHNLFSLGYAYLLSEENKVTDCITFEMLEGMANHLPRLLCSLEKEVVLYTPVVRHNSFLNAISYLVRRLDENTGPDNFLSYSFQLKVGSKPWNFLVEQFEQAMNLKDSLKPYTARNQNRLEPISYNDRIAFKNEPDTDLYLTPNRKWALDVLKRWEKVRGDTFVVPIQVGDEVRESPHIKKYYDRSKESSVCVAKAFLSTKSAIDEIIDIAVNDGSNWSKATLRHRQNLLNRVANNIADQRGELIGCMAAVTGKTFMEGDVEVSEAIDFCRYYPHSMQAFDKLDFISCAPKGVVMVISPWNFPLAIPVGGVAAALASGNRVLLKPATSALPVAWLFAQCFWNAGVPKDALQVVCPKDYAVLAYLTGSKAVKHIILTGGVDTVEKLLQQDSAKPISAELGGKNCIIVTASADQDHAIQSIVQSAFGNSGQKCSACSLLLLDKQTYRSIEFQQKLIDAVESLPVGSAWDSRTLIGPMITNQNNQLKQAIDVLESGESWLVQPKFIDEKGYLMKPAVKWGVKPGSYTFRNELFAPLLGVVSIDSLEDGVRIANSLDYGLTAGLHSLDEVEIEYWKDNIKAGNLYINRGITGAIVNRQPFGGIKKSAYGGGIKAGGPNYVSSFVDFKENKHIPKVEVVSPFSSYSSDFKARERLNYAYISYKEAWDKVFSQSSDWNQVEGEHNVFRYLPIKNLCFRIGEEDKLVDILLILQALKVTGIKFVLSIAVANSNRELVERVVKGEKMRANIVVESNFDFLISVTKYTRVRACSRKTAMLKLDATKSFTTYYANNPPIVEGRVELLNYFNEQSISHEFHRYGSIFDKNS